MTRDSYEQLTAEWRATVLSKLNTLEADVKETKREIVEIKLNTANNAELEALNKKVRSLEDFRIKTVTTLIVIQTLATPLSAYLFRLFTK